MSSRESQDVDGTGEEQTKEETGEFKRRVFLVLTPKQEEIFNLFQEKQQEFRIFLKYEKLFMKFLEPKKAYVYPICDRFVFTPNNSYDSEYILVGVCTVNKNIRRSFLGFDQNVILSIIGNRTLIGAKLEVTLTGTQPKDCFPTILPTVNCHQICDPNLDISMCLWNDSDHLKLTEPISQSNYDQTLFGISGYGWNITELVELWIQDPKTNLGIMLKTENEEMGNLSTVWFCSSRNAISIRNKQEYCPRLILTYNE